MKICIFHELHIGGARKAVDEIATQLKTNNTVDLYYVDEQESRNMSNFYSKTYFYPFQATKWKEKNWKQKIKKDFFDLYRLKTLHEKIANDIKKNTYDVIIVHPSKYTQAPFLLRYISNTIYFCEEPLRIVYDDYLNKNDFGLLRNNYEFIARKIKKSIDKKNINAATYIFSNSKFTKENVKKFYDLDSSVIYLGVNPQFYKPTKKKKNIDVLFIGSPTFIDGYELFQKIKAGLDAQVGITFIDSYQKRLNDTDLRNKYQRSKIVLALAYNEPFGLIPIEAMASGCVVLAVNEGGYKESIINNKTGFLLKRDADNFIKKIHDILANQTIQKVIGENARNDILQNWTWKKTALTFKEYFKTL